MEKRGLLLVLATALISGFSIFFNKFAVSGIDSTVFTFSKNVVVALFLFSAFMLYRNFDQIKILTQKQWGQLALIGLVGGSVPFVLFFKGLQITSSMNSAFIHKMLFVFAAIGAFYFLKEKIDKRFVLGAVMLLAGNALLLKFAWNGLNMGDMLIFIAMLFWAGEQVLSKHVLKNISGNLVAFGRMGFGSLFILLYILATGKAALFAGLSINQMGWILATSVFLLMYVLTWYNGLKHLKVSVATSVLLLGSIITTMLHFVFSGAEVTLGQTVGMLMLVSGTVTIIGFTNFTELFRFIVSSKDGRD